MIYKPKGVCSREIQIEITEEGVIESVTFLGGCAGNAIGISRLVRGMKVQDVIQKLEGVPCGRKQTSCPDQLAQALKELSQ